jgi:hypothetical protein
MLRLIIIQFFVIYVPSQKLQGRLQKQCSVATNNYITEKEKHKSKSHKASFGNITVENYYLYLTQQREA